MSRRSTPAFAGIAVVFIGFVLVACSPDSNARLVVGTEPTSDHRNFAEPPVNAPIDPSARCLDADMPNVGIDESVAYWQNIFDDQRSHYPEQSFPSQQEVESQKRAEWSQVVNDLVPPGGDAAFARDVCGLPQLDGALYSGIPMREVRGHAAELGRRACTSLIEQGAAGLWKSLQAQESDRSDIAAYSYLIHSAIVHVCPQFSDLTAGPTGIVKCANVVPDPSARPGEGVFCVN
ncbi:hypothetical protein ACFRFQ_08165 [Rhodococcus sp. NPDC056743]|uniref:hypothetical protein n=1 Tax=Rhodococcus sp. NPDC056743 TaxID=3345934 RepID=UPI00367103E0